MAGDTDLKEIHGLLAGLVENVKWLREDIKRDRQTVLDNQEKADLSRARVHERLDDVVMRIGYVESDVSGLKNDVHNIQQITDSVSTLEKKALGAGWLGHKLLRIGIFVLGGAGWLVAMWDKIPFPWR